jgi:hypothetical protein
MLGLNHGKPKFILIDISKTFVRRHHFPPYNILCDKWWRLHPNCKISWKLQIMNLATLQVDNSHILVWLKSFKVTSCSPWNELFNVILHPQFEIIWPIFWFFVFKIQVITTSILDLLFGHLTLSSQLDMENVTSLSIFEFQKFSNDIYWKFNLDHLTCNFVQNIWNSHGTTIA